MSKLNESINNAIDKLDSYVLVEEKQILIDKDECVAEAEALANEMGLVDSKWAIEDRKSFTESVYYTYIRSVKADNKLYLDYIAPSLSGNLAPWYANTLRLDELAPAEWRSKVISLIENKFKKAYDHEMSEYITKPGTLAENEFKHYTADADGDREEIPVDGKDKVYLVWSDCSIVVSPNINDKDTGKSEQFADVKEMLMYYRENIADYENMDVYEECGSSSGETFYMLANDPRDI